jgi:hypothetical protein
MWYFGVDERSDSSSLFTPPARRAMDLGLARVLRPPRASPLFFKVLVPSGTRQPLGRAKGYENTSLPLGSRLALIPTYHPASVIGFNPKRGEERTTELGL